MKKKLKRSRGPKAEIKVDPPKRLPKPFTGESPVWTEASAGTGGLVGLRLCAFSSLGFALGWLGASSPETLFRTSWSYSCNYCPSGCPSSCFPTDVFDYNTVAWSGWDNFTNEAMVPVPCLHDRVCVAGLPAVHTSLFPSLLKSLHVGLPICVELRFSSLAAQLCG